MSILYYYDFDRSIIFLCWYLHSCLLCTNIGSLDWLIDSYAIGVLKKFKMKIIFFRKEVDCYSGIYAHKKSTSFIKTIHNQPNKLWMQKCKNSGADKRANI